jgi:two-component system cell cycle response regulator CtrA
VQDEEEAVLHAGADDVVFHPFRMSVMHARMQALARRARGYTCAELVCGNIALDQEQHAVTVDGKRVNLTAREFDFLETLMLHKGVLLTKERFMTRLYADSEAPDSKIVDVFVCKLRRKLAAAGAAEIIRTVWGRGYVVFEPTVEAIAAARLTRQPEAEPAPRGWVRRAPRFLAGAA